MVRIKVELKERGYEVIVGENCLAEVGKCIKVNGWGEKVFIITDPLVNDLYGDTLRKGLKGFEHHTLEVPRGEKNKTLSAAAKVYDALIKHSAHRDSIILALGGGVIGDLAGYVAATYMRGINCIQVPTTLLAQVDASIGGKTGVNHPKCKNLIGCFYQPKMVVCDVKTLTSLPARELRTGLAEVIKYGVIEDAEFFNFLEANSHHLNTQAFESKARLSAALKLWQTIVAESAKIKARVVEKDEKEASLRMILNFGHTIGHAIETLTRYRAYNHGEAVAIGMVAAGRIAERLHLISREAVERIVNLLDKVVLPTEIKGIPADAIVNALMVDKKVKGGKVLFVLPEKIGRVVVKDNIPAKVVKEALEEIGAR